MEYHQMTLRPDVRNRLKVVKCRVCRPRLPDRHPLTFDVVQGSSRLEPGFSEKVRRVHDAAVGYRRLGST